jgi:hypothetical protein
MLSTVAADSTTAHARPGRRSTRERVRLWAYRGEFTVDVVSPSRMSVDVRSLLHEVHGANERLMW